MDSSGLHRFAKFATLATFLLIIAGGLVTSTDSGLSVPDWPLSYGRFFPPMIGGIRFEHAHRVLAGGVGLLTLGLMVLVFLREKRKWVRFLGITAFLAVLTQAVLGGITVIYLLPTFVSVAHACLAQTFLGLLASLSLFTSQEWKEARRVESDQASILHRLLISTTGFIYLQLILGAVVRHTSGDGIVLHILSAFLVLIHVLALLRLISFHFASNRAILNTSLILGLSVLIQFFLGLGAFAVTVVLSPGSTAGPAAVFFTTAHQALGALILATSVVLTLRSFRLVRKPMEEGISTLSGAVYESNG